MVRMGCRHRSESLLAHRLVGIGARSRRMTTLERVAFAVAAVTLAAVVIAKCAQTLAQFLFAGAGVMLAFWTGALDMPTGRTAYLVGAGLVGALGGGWLGFRWFGRRSSRSPARPVAEMGFAAIVCV